MEDSRGWSCSLLGRCGRLDRSCADIHNRPQRTSCSVVRSCESRPNQLDNAPELILLDSCIFRPVYLAHSPQIIKFRFSPRDHSWYGFLLLITMQHLTPLTQVSYHNLRSFFLKTHNQNRLEHAFCLRNVLCVPQTYFLFTPGTEDDTNALATSRVLSVYMSPWSHGSFHPATVLTLTQRKIVPALLAREINY